MPSEQKKLGDYEVTSQKFKVTPQELLRTINELRPLGGVVKPSKIRLI